ncbi:MAG: hemolysin III family protein [Syntrophomonadaceae bacterium]|nr:hemolysin III family protein [Syntrophomonadaceae bacterium]
MLICRLRDPVNGLTHLVGVVLSVVGAVFLIYAAAQHAQAGYVVAASIFGASLLLLYTASTLYHLLPLSDRGTAILRRVDHMMIFVLIAGTYTPLCLITLAGKWGWILLWTIWGLAAVGVAMKLFWFNAPRWFSTLFYVLMGAIVVAFLPLLSGLLSPAAVAWIAGGGILYIIGAIIYATKLPILNCSRWFGFHEVFHLFVLGGSFCHFWFIYNYVLA